MDIGEQSREKIADSGHTVADEVFQLLHGRHGAVSIGCALFGAQVLDTGEPERMMAGKVTSRRHQVQQFRATKTRYMLIVVSFAICVGSVRSVEIIGISRAEDIWMLHG